MSLCDVFFFYFFIPEYLLIAAVRWFFGFDNLIRFWWKSWLLLRCGRAHAFEIIFQLAESEWFQVEKMILLCSWAEIWMACSVWNTFSGQFWWIEFEFGTGIGPGLSWFRLNSLLNSIFSNNKNYFSQNGVLYS